MLRRRLVRSAQRLQSIPRGLAQTQRDKAARHRQQRFVQPQQRQCGGQQQRYRQAVLDQQATLPQHHQQAGRQRPLLQQSQAADKPLLAILLGQVLLILCGEGRSAARPALPDQQRCEQVQAVQQKAAPRLGPFHVRPGQSPPTPVAQPGQHPGQTHPWGSCQQQTRIKQGQKAQQQERHEAGPDPGQQHPQRELVQQVDIGHQPVHRLIAATGQLPGVADPAKYRRAQIPQQTQRRLMGSQPLAIATQGAGQRQQTDDGRRSEYIQHVPRGHARQRRRGDEPAGQGQQGNGGKQRQSAQQHGEQPARRTAVQ